MKSLDRLLDMLCKPPKVKPTSNDIDFNQYDVLGWQPWVSGQKVEAIKRGIEEGDQIPPVPVAAIGERYVLTPYVRINLKLTDDSRSHRKNIKIADGGHHRAVAFFQMGMKLPVLEYPSSFVYELSVIPISQILLVHDPTSYSDAKTADPNYR